MKRIGRSLWTERRALGSSVVLLLILLALASARAQKSTPSWELATPQPRITQAINDAVTVRIPHSTPTILKEAVDLGRMRGSTKLGPMFLVLRSSSAQEHALHTLLDRQQDKTSQNFHLWLTPDEFGSSFGVAQGDLQKITNWLTQEGLKVDKVARGRRAILFSGTAAAVNQAFHTPMHYYLVQGKRHFSNSADISIPAAFSKVVIGVASLNDFGPISLHTPPHTISIPLRRQQKTQSYYDTASGSHYLSPGDFATIYNTLPLLQGSVDGAGVTIGIIGDSDISQQDSANITQFRQIFLPNYNANNINLISSSVSGCADPGTVSKEAEEYLDVEWAGAVAPRATIDYVPAPNSNLYCAALYLVDSNVVSIVSVSFGQCEYNMGSSAANTAYSELWEQAAAQGITVFVSAGDSGSAGCDVPISNDTTQVAVNGFGVNGLASTPFDVSVGGTEFDEGSNTSYWSSANSSTTFSGLTFTSALGYIPEQVWNESGLVGGGYGIWAGGGGESVCYARPPWQVGPGVPSSDPISVSSPAECPVVMGQHRYVPDISLTAAGHDGYLICDPQYPCSVSSGYLTAGTVGGTSAAAPSFAGIQALVDENRGRQGQADYTYYALAAQQSTSSCNSTGSGGPSSSCVFNDTTLLGNNVPCAGGSPDCSSTTSGTNGTLTGFFANPGYDLAAGLGSVNAYNLYEQWNNVTLRSTTTSLTITDPASGVATYGQSVKLQATVSVSDGEWGAPMTGQTVTFYDESNSTQLGTATLALQHSAQPYDYIATFTTPNSLTVGTHSIIATYNGPGYVGSTSATVTVTVQAQQSLPTLTGLTTTPTTVASGESATVTATLSAAAPSGGTQVDLKSSDPSAFPAPASITIAGGQTSGTSSAVVAGSVAGTTSVTLTGSYNGGSVQATVVVNPSSQTSPTITLAASPTTASLGQTVALTATFSGASSGAPTGPAYFYDDFNGTATELGTPSFSSGASSGQYVASLSTNSLLAGTHRISVTYHGDSNYTSALSNVVDVSIQQGSQGSLVLSSLVLNPPTVVGGSPSYGTVTLTGNAPSGGAVVSLTSNNTHFVTVPPTVTVSPGYNSVVFPITTQFTGGTTTATIIASYNGTTYGATLTVLPVAVSGVTFYPSSVTAGDAAPLTVYLTGPAPAGTSVSFANSDPSVLQLSSSVPVPEGATSVSVTGTTLAVGTQTKVTVTASYNNSSGQGSLTVVPAPPLTLNTFNISPQTITGGTSTTGTVWLTAPAPSGGVSVTLTNPSSLVQMQTSVQVSGGSASASFTIGTSTVAAVTNVSLAASYGGVSQNVTLTIVPPLPYLTSITLAPSTVNGGSSSTGTVTLTAPAPVGGISVNLTNQSGYITIANVPTVVSITAGATTGTFTVTTSPTAFIVPVEITASYNGTSQSTTLTVVPPGTPLAPSSLSFNPVSVTGGSSSTGAVTLTEPAPTGGVVISLSSDNPDVVVPPSVNVPAGEASTVFTATTSSVSNVTTATVVASLNGISQSGLLTVEPSGAPAPGNPVPFLASPLVPLSHTPSSTDLALTVNGTGFVPGSQILWNDKALPTTVVSNSELQTSVPAANAQTNGSFSVTAQNPGSGTSQSNTLAEHLTYASSTPQFNTSVLSVNGEPFSVATGDFNGDGKLDLAVGNADGTGLSILLGNGNGSFGPERIIPAVSSMAVALGDFNGDGKLDIAFVKSNSVGITLGNGDGAFTAMPDIPLPSAPGSWASIAVGDFNGDGNLDIVATGSSLTGAYVLLGKGDGTFGAPTLVGSVNQPTSVAVADFNNDGNLDIALTDNSGQAVAILLGNGNGTFQAQQEYPTNGYSNGLAVGDFDGDGHPDIAVSNGGPVGGTGAGIAILHNNGNGTFAAPVTYGAGQVFDYIAADDLNGDGKLDLVTTTTQPSPEALIFLGNGDGTFSTTALTEPLSGTAPVTIADINDDGAPDILVPDANSSASTVTLLVQTIAPILQASPSSLFFNAVQGGNAPASATLSISNTGGGTVSWSASASQPWLSLGQASGTAPASVSVTANPSGLAAGTYSATITLSDTGAANSPQTIPVSFAVNPTPISVGSLAFNPTALTGPGSATGTVTLSSAAPAGGATVTLSSDNSAVTVPSTATVAAGATSGTFAATASSVTTQTVATITATYNGVSTTAKLTVNPSAPVAGISPTSLTFANEVVGQTSAPQNVTVTNTGTASLSFSSIAATGDFSVQSAGTTCSTSSSLAVNSNCTISVTFTPTASGSRTGTLSITDNATGSPQTVTLTGTGTSAVATLSATSETFPGEVVDTASPQQPLTLKNTGSAALTISGISIGGANAGDFAQTNNCSSSVGAGASCAINITFKPTAAGARAGALSVSDNATGSPQTVTLSGTGEDFTLGVASGGSSTDTVTAGSTATYSMSVAPEGGFNQAVSISCTGAPSLATCTASPASVTPDGKNPAAVSITVSTTAATGVPPGPAPALPPGGEKLIWPALGLLLLVFLGIFAPRPRRRAWLALAFTMALTGMSAACGGGGPSPTTGAGGGNHTAGTPTGTYSLTVSGSDGSLTHSTTLTLTVQ